MWKHIPAKENHQLKAGDRIQVRWGKLPSYEFRISSGNSNGLIIGLYDQDGDRKSELTRRSENTHQLRHDFNWHVTGGAFDLWVPDEKIIKPIPSTVKASSGWCPNTTDYEAGKDSKNLPFGLTFPAIGDTFVLKGILTTTVVAFVNFSHSNCIVRDPFGSVIDKIPNEEFNWDRVTRELKHHTCLYQRLDKFADFYRALMAKVAEDKAKKAERQAEAEAVRIAKAISKVALCPNGAKAIPEREEFGGKYIVWCPTSDLPPRVILEGASKAKAVAASMSERHGTDFYWCKLVGKVTQKKVTTTKTLITLL